MQFYLIITPSTEMLAVKIFIFSSVHLCLPIQPFIKSSAKFYDNVARATTIYERLQYVKNDSNFEITALFRHLYGE